MKQRLMIEIAKLKKQVDALDEDKFNFTRLKKDYIDTKTTADLKKDVLKKIKDDIFEESDIIKIINLAKNNNDLEFIFEIAKLLKTDDIKAKQMVVFYLNKYNELDLLKKLIKKDIVSKDFVVEIIGGYEEIIYLQGNEADEYVKYFEDGKKKQLFDNLSQFDYGDGGEWFFEDEIRPKSYDFLKNNIYAAVCNTRIGDIGFYKIIKGIGLSKTPTK